MPTADVVVIGAGLAGLVSAHALAQEGARVIVLAKGMATTHWTAGSIDVAAPAGATTAREGVQLLAGRRDHPYAMLQRHVEGAVSAVRDVLAAQGLPMVGDLDSPIRTMPTGIGGTRPVSIVPDAQADAMPEWGADETLIVCGIDGFKDFWPTAIAASIARPTVWPGPGSQASATFGPASVVAATAGLPRIADRHNLTALHVARAFDDSTWRHLALDAIAAAVERVRPLGPARVGMPAMLGLRDHAAALADMRDRVGLPVFEMPLVPPSIPGLRMFDALRRAVLAAGVRIQIGENVARFETNGRRVSLIATPAAVREFTVRAGAVVLATGGIAGGGLVARSDGSLDEAVLRLPVEAPPRESWFATDPFDPEGHPLETAGVRVDDELRPVDRKGKPTFENVRVVGANLAGQRWIHERCGDGVAVASAHQAALTLSRDGFKPGPPIPSTADSTGAAVAAGAGGEWRD
jgi:glycerol-3-phosphate dehydrogenase subunit B